MLFQDRFKQRTVARGPDCGCGGTCSFCAPMLGRMYASHAREIREGTKHLDVKKPAEKPEKENADSK